MGGRLALRSTHEAVLAELRRQIIGGRFPPGSRIPQDELAAELGVSRIPLREALHVLQGEGQVEYLPNRGYRIADLSWSELRSVYELRELLESRALADFGRGGQESALKKAMEAEKAFEESARRGDLMTMNVENRHFHFALLSSCGNHYLIRLIETLWNCTDVYRTVYYNDSRYRARVVKDHRGILRALQAGDIARAIRLSDSHRSAAVKSLAPFLATSEEADH